MALGAPHPRQTTGSGSQTSRTPNPEILKELGEIPDEGVKRHIPVLLTSPILTMVDTHLIRERLGTSPQPHFSESRDLWRPVVTERRRLFPVWDLTPDGFFDVWMQCLSRMLDSSVVSGVHN